MAVVFGGTGKYIRRTTGLPASTSITVCAWMYIDSLRASQYQYWLCVENATTNATKYLVQGYSNAARWDIVNTDVNVGTSTEPPTGAWIFSAMSCAGTGSTDAKGYFRRIGDTALTTGSAPGTSFTPAMVMLGNDSYDEWTNTRFGPAYIFNRALSPFEIAALSFNAYAIPAGLVAGVRLAHPGDIYDIRDGTPWTVGGTLTQGGYPPIIVRPWIIPFVPAAGAQTITPAGIASAEAFGTAVLQPGTVTVTPTGIAGGEAFGTATVSTTAAGQTISPTGIASAEAFGTATIVPGTATVTPTGIASAFVTGTTELLMAACIGGVLTVDSTNGRYFRNSAGTLLLAGFHTWYVSAQDGGPSDPPPALDYDAWLNYVAARGCNWFKFWFLESSREWPDATGQYFAPHPWPRTGPSNAADGKLRFDLSQHNQDYFDRLRARVIEAGNRGMYVTVQLFQGWMVENKTYTTGYPWTYHPMQAGNNINSIDGDTDNDGDGLETRVTTFTAVYDIQKAYVEYVLDTLNDLDNVLYEISNEDNPSSEAWQKALIDHIHSYESSLAQQHPVGMTKLYRDGTNSQLTSSNAEWLSLDDTTASPDQADGSFVIHFDTDHAGGLVYEHTWIWKAFCHGNNLAFMDEYDGLLYGTDKRSDATNERIRNNLGYALDYAAQLDLANTTPQPSLASTGYCLARMSGTAQLIAYQPGSGSFTVNLTSVSGTFSLEWLRPSTGATQAGSNVSGGAVRTITPPWSGEDVVAFLELTELTITPAGIASSEAFGTASIIVGAVTIAPAGIASAEAFGSGTLVPGAVTVAPSGIASTEVFGTAITQPGGVTVAPTGVASGEAFGVATLAAGAVTIVGAGIATAEAFGTALFQAGASYIAPTGIASAEGYGDATVLPGTVSILLTGIASGETHGETLLATGAVLQPTGIASGEAHGATVVQPGAVSILTSGISTTEAFGTAALLVDLLVTAAGIATGEAFGDALLSVGGAFIQPTGIDSGETFGDLVAMAGAVSILPTGIAGGEAFGTLRLVVAGADQYIDVPSVQDGETFGIATLLMALIAERTLSVRAETRRYVVAAENRTYSVTR